MSNLPKEKELQILLKKLSGQQIVNFYDIPDEYRLNPFIVQLERKLGIRKTNQCGYDVLHDNFFVEEIVLCENYLGTIIEKTIFNYFPDFNEFYQFLQGEIYDRSCYFLYDFSPLEIEKYSIDLKRINKKALITSNVSNYSLGFSQSELCIYREKEKEKSIRKKLIDQLIKCKNYVDFEKAISNLKKKNLNNDFMFFIFCFIFSCNNFAFKILNEYIKQNDCWELEQLLCLIYNPDDVLSNYFCRHRALSTNKKYKSKLKSFIKLVREKRYKISIKKYFDETNHFFCVKQLFYFDNYYSPFEICRYFDSFVDFVEYLDKDLTSCDLSKAILPNVNFSLYKIDKTTKLPIEYQKGVKYFIIKEYDRISDTFNVTQYWITQKQKILKRYDHTFKYFFDFAYFLNYDLSNSNLLFCDGLKKINDYSIFNLKGSILKSEILEKLGIKYQKYNLHKSIQEPKNSFIIENEKSSTEILKFQRSEISDTLLCKTIYYISDLHLLHRLKAFVCKSETDVVYALQKIIDNLLKDIKHLYGVLLIAGDTSSDFKIFSAFVRLLRNTLDEQNFNLTVIFTLGNHELWEFDNYDFEDIIKQYKELLYNYQMYLIQNELIYIEDNNINIITAKELKIYSTQKIRNALVKSRLIIFGGLGFSGNNQFFNANDGIYKKVINREKEIFESELLNSLYNKICSTLPDKNIIILTHMPKKDWSKNNELQSGFIYINGHNHKNYYYSDGMTSVYADNQIGYFTKDFYTKYFYFLDTYDIFSEYKDGIYIITPQEYKDFYYGKHLYLNFNRDIHILYMLKKNGYYCFIHQAKDKKLALFNGGALKRLYEKDINYYYENMDRVISYIKSPLKEFTDFQKKVSNEIKAIGGDGFIHGAIIDIGYCCHVYVNPLDLKITYYWGSDIIRKILYKDFSSLLKNHNEKLYTNYCNQLKEKNNLIIQTKENLAINKTKMYLETDIYRVSNEVRKMQKLNNNILTVWYEGPPKLLLKE